MKFIVSAIIALGVLAPSPAQAQTSDTALTSYVSIYNDTTPVGYPSDNIEFKCRAGGKTFVLAPGKGTRPTCPTGEHLRVRAVTFVNFSHGHSTFGVGHWQDWVPFNRQGTGKWIGVSDLGQSPE